MKRSSEEVSPATATKKQWQQQPKKKISLLLHAVDGCVPYLTPSVLERHFPPSDDFWIGLSVRNTSVVPCYEKVVQLKKSKQKKEIDPRDLKAVAKEKNKKPRGYTFDAVAPDPWLLPYTRVTVPSFDLLYDNEIYNRKSKNEASSENKTSSLNTNKYVSIWSSHGRQKLSPELYAKAAINEGGLKSQYTLSLFDMNEEGICPKRQKKALVRSTEWFQDLVNRSNQGPGSSSMLWSPVLLPNESGQKPPKKIYGNDNKIQMKVVESSSGIALIGRWRDKCLSYDNFINAILEANKNQNKYVAILSTHSMKEVLDIICSGLVNVIGTDLPSRWAKNKCAIGIDIPTTSGETASENKRAKREGDDAEEQVITSSPIFDSDGCMNMNDKRYARDTRPLVPGCSCLACNNNEFSRAYIHHLVQAKELLAEILLFSHNLHNLLELVRAFNKKENEKQSIKDAITKQIKA